MAVSIIRSGNPKTCSFLFFKIDCYNHHSFLSSSKCKYNKFLDNSPCNQECALEKKRKKNYSKFEISSIFAQRTDNFQRFFANYYGYRVQLSRDSTTYNRC